MIFFTRRLVTPPLVCGCSGCVFSGPMVRWAMGFAASTHEQKYNERNEHNIYTQYIL